jgi:hypothetical protein
MAAVEKLRSSKCNLDTAKLNGDECKSVLTFGSDREPKETAATVLRKELKDELVKGRSTVKFWAAYDEVETKRATAVSELVGEIDGTTTQADGTDKSSKRKRRTKEEIRTDLQKLYMAAVEKLRSSKCNLDTAKLNGDECKSVLTFGFNIVSKETAAAKLRRELKDEPAKGKSTATFWTTAANNEADEEVHTKRAKTS